MSYVFEAFPKRVQNQPKHISLPPRNGRTIPKDLFNFQSLLFSNYKQMPVFTNLVINQSVTFGVSTPLVLYHLLEQQNLLWQQWNQARSKAQVMCMKGGSDCSLKCWELVVLQHPPSVR